MDSAVIFDVDGVLLELTRDEEEIFFATLARFVSTEHLSRDWNSYRIRNDEDIISEILEKNGLPHSYKTEVIAHYLATLRDALNATIRSVAIPGAKDLLSSLHGTTSLGIATANLKAAAAMRLQQLGLWDAVSDHAQGADGGGHKHEILARLLATLPVPPDRIIYVGDNLNDVEAGLRNGVHFIGFSTNPTRCSQLKAHGAPHTSPHHSETIRIIRSLLA